MVAFRMLREEFFGEGSCVGRFAFMNAGPAEVNGEACYI
jgi:hypothetical protein